MKKKIFSKIVGIILNFPPSDKRVTNAKNEIINRIKSERFDSFIYIVPTRRKVRELRREFLNFARNGVAPEFNLFTLDMFAHRLYLSAETQKVKRLISETVQNLIFSKAIEDVFDSLKYFKPPKIEVKFFLLGLPERPTTELPTGTINKLIETILGLKEDGIYPEVIMKGIEAISKEDDRFKMEDIAKIYEKYELLLTSNRFIDKPGIFKELNSILTNENISEVFRKTFLNADLIVIEGFSVFRAPEIELIKKLTKVRDVQVRIIFDYFENNDNLFKNLNECYQKLVEAGFKKYEIRPATENDKFAKHLNRYLFNYIGSKFEKYDARKFVTLVKARDRIDEVKTIARIIKKIVRENPDIDLNKICVATYRPGKYTSLFREIFPLYGIPANITDRYYLEKSPLVSSIISLLEVPVNDFTVKDIVKVLMSPYFNILNKNGERISPANIYSVSKKMKILDNKENYWVNRVQRQIEIVRSKLETTGDPDERSELENELKLLENALADFETLRSIVSEISNDKMTPSEFKDKLRKVLRELKVEEQILKIPRKIAENDEIERDARAYQKFWEVVDEFLEVFEFNIKKREAYGLERYVELLKTAISRVRYNIRQKYGYGVFVTALEETRGLNFDIMIIAGLVDTEFPSIYEPEFFLSEELRKTEEMHRLDERYLFYQGIVNFKTHLYLTYPEMDGENELVRSRFIDSLKQIAEIEETDSSKFTDGIYSKAELYETYGRFIKENIDKIKTFELIETKFPKLVASFGTDLKRICEHAQINISRTETHSRPEYEGIILPELEDEKAKLIAHREEIFSISQLETYAKCPFRYFAERILKLQGFEEIEELLTPIERGILYHSVAYKFYSKWIESGKKISENRDEALKLAIEIAKDELKSFEIKHPLWEIEQQRLFDAIENFIDMEIKLEEQNFRPSHFEVGFGPKIGARTNIDPELSTQEPVQLGNLKIQGKVDRIDVRNDSFIIIDYKTGYADVSFDNLKEGLHLQIPLYIKAVEEIYRRKGSLKRGVAGINYPLRDFDNLRLKYVIADKEAVEFKSRATQRQFLPTKEYDELLNEIVSKANNYIEQIASGEFPLTKYDQKLNEICRNCPYLTICRINETKFSLSIQIKW